MPCVFHLLSNGVGMFKVGDRVRCIKTGASRVLVISGVYTVNGVTGSGCLTLVEVQVKHAYKFDKFVKVSTFKGNK